ncbi:hypothetical protein GCM10025859_60090 [Alicyclobacillus fastidiosus]|nr:hypothetical protein GCM10025859_01600 [Alicyclobacillus fastidiosus]GMA65569.1 hypothetical protein GCM10025859_60090 [Alicyclobacillus fastidiosus]
MSYSKHRVTHVTSKVMYMRCTNLTGQSARDAMTFMRENNIQCAAKLERELERGVELHERTVLGSHHFIGSDSWSGGRSDIVGEVSDSIMDKHTSAANDHHR